MKHTFINIDEVHIQSYASLVMLQKVYTNLEQKRWNRARKAFVKKELETKGKLVCSYCGKDDLKIKSNKRHEQCTVDHIIPVSQGGNQFDDRNFTISCYSCNKKKASKPAEEFKKSKYLQKKKKSL